VQVAIPKAANVILSRGGETEFGRQIDGARKNENSPTFNRGDPVAK
jgi:hypothetical protein